METRLFRRLVETSATFLLKSATDPKSRTTSTSTYSAFLLGGLTGTVGCLAWLELEKKHEEKPIMTSGREGPNDGREVAIPSDGFLSATEQRHAAWVMGGLPPSAPYRRVSATFVSEYDARTRNPRWVVERHTAATPPAPFPENDASGKPEEEGGPLPVGRGAPQSAPTTDAAATNSKAPETTVGTSASAAPSSAAAAATVAVPVSRAGHGFKEDGSVPWHLRAHLDAYAGSGLDRGHLAAAADQRTHAGMAESFRLSNISPQVGVGFNRDYWSRLEKFVRDLPKELAAGGAAAAAAGEDDDAVDVFVCTGPLFLPSLAPPPSPREPPKRRRRLLGRASPFGGAAQAKKAPSGEKEDALGGHGGGDEGGNGRGEDCRPSQSWVYDHAALGGPPQWIAVPTHFFKVVVVTDRASGAATSAGAFVLPNAAIAPSENLSAFAVPLYAVEAAAGLTLFPSLLAPDAKVHLDAVACASFRQVPGESGGESGPAATSLAENAARVLAPAWHAALRDARDAATNGERQPATKKRGGRRGKQQESDGRQGGTGDGDGESAPGGGSAAASTNVVTTLAFAGGDPTGGPHRRRPGVGAGVGEGGGSSSLPRHLCQVARCELPMAQFHKAQETRLPRIKAARAVAT